jgi:ribosomal protein S12 methylthiotransferase accessory factor
MPPPPLRSVPAGETLARLAPYRAEMGITRIANITGLDCVGLPVTQACRPNARSVAISLGKGLDLDAAKASALMESVETWHAERVAGPLWYGAAAELGRRHRLADCAAMVQRADSRFSPGLEMLWAVGHPLGADQPVLIPYEAVHAAFVAPYPPGSGCFLASTNGLASGNTAEEAALHALCELIERDATTLFRAAPAGWPAARLDPGSVDDPACRSALACFRAAGLLLAVWDITSDVGVPAFWACVAEPADGPGLVAAPVDGFGCHPLRAVALHRALGEAAQGRAGMIAGARDDVPPDIYRPMEDPDWLDRWRGTIESGPAPRRLAELPELPAADAAGALAAVAARLAACGLAEILLVDLAPADRPYAVVRAVVPGLEPPLHADYAPGRRAAGRR